MTPLQFEADYAPVWAELEEALAASEGTSRKASDGASRKSRRSLAASVDGARLSMLYRRVCEHLALAQARAYPIHLTQRLESLTHRAHRLIYRRHDYGMARFKQLVLIDFPQGVRQLKWYVLVATLVFVLPMLLTGWAAYHDPGFVLHVIDGEQVQQFDGMYGDGDRSIGQSRDAESDWYMFGYYIMNNIGVGFRCFAAGLFLGVGSLFFLAFNGVFAGVVAGYLTDRGYAENFYSFVVTHAAFELTAIVLAGAAGLRLGHALLAPGRRTRLEALKHAAGEAVVIIYGVIGMLLIAAAVEAFWSSSRWVEPAVKYAVAAVCWTLVLAYLGWQGRPASPAPEAAHAS